MFMLSGLNKNKGVKKNTRGLQYYMGVNSVASCPMRRTVHLFNAKSPCSMCVFLFAFTFFLGYIRFFSSASHDVSLMQSRQPHARDEMYDEFFDAVADIDAKNNGGCLFFCYAFLLWAKQEGIDLSTFRIKQYAVFDEIEHNTKFFNGEVGSAKSSWHFTWLINDVEYDGNGPTPPVHIKKFHIFSGDINKLENFCINALENGSWNHDFCRVHAIDVIRDNLNINIKLKKR